MITKKMNGPKLFFNAKRYDEQISNIVLIARLISRRSGGL